MDTVTILRALWRRRLAVLGVTVFALFVGAAVLFQLPSLKSRQYTVGVANTSILLDTPNSQVVEVAPKGSDTLGVRATLLASLMVDGVVKTAIAQNAGLNPTDLTGISTVATDQSATGPKNPRDPVLTTQVVTDADGTDLPIIEVTAQAADAAKAEKLANASVTGLRAYLDSKAAIERIPDAQRLQVTGLSVPQAHTATQGPGKVLAVIAMIFVFCLGCGAILGVVGLKRAWRAAAAREAAWPGDEPGFATVDVRPDVDDVEPAAMPTRSHRVGIGDPEWGERWLAPDPEVRSGA